MPSVDPFLADITRVALAVAQRHGFALGGGNALVLHGVVDRPTADVDLFTDRDDAVRIAARLVLDALTSAGLDAAEVVGDDPLDGLRDLLVEIEVTSGARTARVSLAGQPRVHAPVVMDVGPVIHLDDLVAAKAAAIVNRREVRDYIDTAAFLADRTAEDVIALARRVDPGLEEEDVVMVGRHLDRMPDHAFARYGLTSPSAIAELRSRFVGWPR